MRPRAVPHPSVTRDTDAEVVVVSFGGFGTIRIEYGWHPATPRLRVFIAPDPAAELLPDELLPSIEGLVAELALRPDEEREAAEVDELADMTSSHIQPGYTSPTGHIPPASGRDGMIDAGRGDLLRG